MSLAPGELRALARIEEALRCSDPRLETMLATFTLPAGRRLLTSGTRLLRWPIKRFLLMAGALGVIGVTVFGLVASHPSQRMCVRQPPGSSAFGLIGACQSAGGGAPSPLNLSAGGRNTGAGSAAHPAVTSHLGSYPAGPERPADG